MTLEIALYLIIVALLAFVGLYILDLRRKNKELEDNNRELEETTSYWKHHAHLDPVTGQLNRLGLDQALSSAVQRANNINAPEHLGVLLVDLDHFKNINDTHGHPVGDEVLRFVAKIMRQCVRFNDIIARFGGDEIAVILDGADSATVRRLGREVHQAVRDTPFQLDDGRFIHVSVSTGGVSRQGPNIRASNLLKVADARLYRSKEGKGSGEHEAVVDSIRDEPEELNEDQVRELVDEITTEPRMDAVNLEDTEDVPTQTDPNDEPES